MGVIKAVGPTLVSYGTCFQVPEGLLTAKHVVQEHLIGDALIPGTIITVQDLLNTFVERYTELKMFAREYDVAVLEKSSRFQELEWGKKSDMEVGDEVIVVAAPETLENPNLAAYAAVGKLLAIHHFTPDILMYAIPVLPGSSGGPVLNMEGKVIGMNIMRIGGGPGDPSATGAGLWSDAILAGLSGTREQPKLTVAIPGLSWPQLLTVGIGIAVGVELLRAIVGE